MANLEARALFDLVMSPSAGEGYRGGDFSEPRIFTDNLQDWLNRRADEACGEDFDGVTQVSEEIFFNEQMGDSGLNEVSADSKAVFRSVGYQPRVIFNALNDYEPDVVNNSHREDLS